MIVAGILLPIVALFGNTDLLSQSQTPESVRRLIGPLLLLGLGGLLLVIGLVINAVRALIVRAALPPSAIGGRRSSSCSLLAAILGTVVALGAGQHRARALRWRRAVGWRARCSSSPRPRSACWQLTGGLVVAPRALAGVRIVGRTGLGRSLLIGLGAAIPAWIGATLLGALAAVVAEGGRLLRADRDRWIRSLSAATRP